MAREISVSDREVGDAIWELARKKFATKASLARELSVSAQYLNAYLSGAKRPGILFFKKLADIGLDVSVLPGAEQVKPFISPTPQIPRFASALHDAMQAMRRTPSTLARAVGVDEEIVNEWLSGKEQPGYEALGTLFVLTAQAAVTRTCLTGNYHTHEVRGRLIPFPLSRNRDFTGPSNPGKTR